MWTNEDLDRMIKDGEIKFPSGRKVKFRRIPPGLFLTWRRSHQPPDPPMREVPVVGGGVEELPDADDPEYLEALARFSDKTGEDWLEIVYRHLEPTMPKNDDWIEDMAGMGIEVPDTKRGREVMYLKCIVLDSTEDLALASAVLSKASGVTEERVDEALETFRRDVGGDTNSAGGGEEGPPASGEPGGSPAASVDDKGTDALGVDRDNIAPGKPSPRVRTKRSGQVRRG